LLFSSTLLPTQKEKKKPDTYILNYCMHQGKKEAILHCPCEK
jgi:hypothetical protein